MILLSFFRSYVGGLPATSGTNGESLEDGAPYILSYIGWFTTKATMIYDGYIKLDHSMIMGSTIPTSTTGWRSINQRVNG